MTEFERITTSPAILGAFLGSLPCLEGPWDDAFHREFCDKCEEENCDACPHKEERNSPTSVSYTHLTLPTNREV